MILLELLGQKSDRRLLVRPMNNVEDDLREESVYVKEQVHCVGAVCCGTWVPRVPCPFCRNLPRLSPQDVTC